MQANSATAPVYPSADQEFRRLILGLIVFTVVMSIVPDGFDWSNPEEGQTTSGGSIIRQVQWLPPFLLSFYLIWRRRVVSLSYLRDVNPFLIAFVVFLAATALWSPFPVITIKRVIQVVGVLGLAAVFQIAAWYPERFARVLRNTLAVLMIGSVLFALLIPSIGTHTTPPHTGSWQGLTTHKNHLGQMAAVGLAVWFHALLAASVKRWVAAGFSLMAILLILMAGSSSGLAMGGVALVVMFWLMRPIVSMSNWLTFTLVSMLALVMVPMYFFVVTTGDFPGWSDLVGPVAELFGKDASLTGRDVLWDEVWRSFLGHPVGGYGYGAFWRGDEGPSGEIAAILYWIAFQSHNGYLDILNETGSIGFGLFALYLLLHVWRMIRLYSFDSNAASLHIVVLLLILMGNWSESSFFRPVYFFCFLLIWSSLTVDRHLSPLGRVIRRTHYRPARAAPETAG